MSYILRIHKQESAANMQGEGWVINGAGNGASIPCEKITDTIQKTINGKEGTSIPTPFARIYLFKTACESIRMALAEHADAGASVEVNPLYKKYYCHCLDLLQFLFEHGKETLTHNSKFAIMQVDLTQGEKHKVFNDYFPLVGYAFDQAVKAADKNGRLFFSSPLYVISYDGILLGGTSPFTFVYTSPNLEREIAEKEGSNINWLNPFYSNKKARFFSSDTKDLKFLSERPIEFQRYVHSLLDICNRPGEDHRSEIMSCFMYDTAFDYNPSDLICQNILSSDSSGNLITPNGINLCYNDSKVDMSHSSFKMAPTNFKGKYIPLALPSTPFQKNNWTYIDDQWDSKTCITDGQCLQSPDVQKRTLPKPGAENENSTIEYPWVSEPDFFEMSLYDLGYDLNDGGEGHYFAPKLNGDYPFRFLLPIKPAYFEYFTVDDLKKNLKVTADANVRKSTHKNIVTFSWVEFTLTIPLENGRTIDFKRKYTKAGLKSMDGQSQETNYRLVEMSDSFAISIFPFYRIINNENSNIRNAYAVHLFSQFPKLNAALESDDDLRLRFIDKNGSDQDFANYGEQKGIERSNIAKVGWTRIYSVRPLERDDSQKTDFDSIRVLAGKDNDPVVVGLFVPEFKIKHLSENQNRRACFAIDFGTTNTHIAYLEDRNYKPFTILENEMQAVSTAKPFYFDGKLQYRSDSNHDWAVYESIRNYSDYLREFVPSLIGNNTSLVKSVEYPVKTATLETPKTIAKYNTLFATANIGYDIDSEEVSVDSGQWEYSTNIKWGLRSDKATDSKKRVQMYCEQTLWMIKNAIIEKQLYPNNISLVYFYPESMSIREKQAFAEIWGNAKKEIFDKCNFTNCNITSMLESVAPYYSLVSTYRNLFTNNYLNIDIGGGTTDYFLIEKEGNDECGFESSIMFAGNNLWGESRADDRGNADTPNGFIDSMESKIARGSTILPSATKAYENFSGKECIDQTFKGKYKNGMKNQDMAGFLFSHDSDYHFTQMLCSDEAKNLRFVLYLHYAAIVFYASEMFKEIKKHHADFVFPRVISYTGKGSEYIKMLGDEDAVTVITKYLFISFNKNLDGSKIKDMRVIFPESPKIVTAEGGVRKNTIADDSHIVWVESSLYKGSSSSNDDDRFAAATVHEQCGSEKPYYNLTKQVKCYDLDGDESMDIKSPAVMNAVMESFDSFIKDATNKNICNYLLTLGISVPDNFYDSFRTMAEDSYMNCSKLDSDNFSDKNSLTVSLAENNLFFYTLRLSLIDLSSKYTI